MASRGYKNYAGKRGESSTSHIYQRANPMASGFLSLIVGRDSPRDNPTHVKGGYLLVTLPSCKQALTEEQKKTRNGQVNYKLDIWSTALKLHVNINLGEGYKFFFY